MKHFFLYLLILLVSLAFYMMNSYEPLRCDDLIYQYYWLNERTLELLEPVDLNNRIDDISEAFNSQINHYFVMNGRFIVHLIVSCFCGFLGRPMFGIFNTIVYVIFIFGCLKFLNLNDSIKSVIAVAVIWLGLPVQYILWYSVAFSVNYLWTSTAFVYFLILVKSRLNYGKYTSILVYVLLFLIGFFFGMLHEGFSLPLSGAIFFSFLLNKKKCLKTTYVFMTLGLWLGTAIVVFAPGTIGRGTNSLCGVSIEQLILMKVNVLRYSKRLMLFAVLLIFCYISNKDRIKSFVEHNSLIITFLVVDFCFVLAVPHYSQRMAFPLELLSLLLSVDLILNSKFMVRYKKYICFLVVPLLFIHVPLTVYYAKASSREYVKMLNMYLKSPNGVTCYDNISIPKCFRSYVHRLDEGVEKDYISFVYGKKMYIE